MLNPTPEPRPPAPAPARSSGPVPIPKAERPRLFDAINRLTSGQTCRLYLTQPIRTDIGDIPSDQVTGVIREIAVNVICNRRSSDDRAHTDLIIPKQCVLYIEESYSAE